MKKLTFIGLLCLLAMLPARAQQFRVGFSAGVNITDVDGTDPLDGDDDFKKFGIEAGLFVNTHLDQRNIMQMEFSYSEKGAQFPPDTSLANFNNNNYFKLRLHYVDVNLLWRHRLHLNFKKPNDNFDFELGAGMGYLFSYSYYVKSIDFTQYLNPNLLDFEGFAGFSYNFSDNFSVDVRYYNSINPVIPSNANNSQWLYYGSWNRGHNLDFQITLKFTIGADVNSPVTPPPPTAPPATPNQ